MGERKAFCRKRISRSIAEPGKKMQTYIVIKNLESDKKSCDLLDQRVGLWNSHENKEVKPVQPVQMNIYQSTIYRKDKSRIQERQQMKDQQSYISVSEAYLTPKISS